MDLAALAGAVSISPDTPTSLRIDPGDDRRVVVAPRVLLQPGTAYTLGTAEYRFPLWNVELGAWTLPFYLRRLHAAMYTDVGDAYTPGRRDFHLHAGAGAELRAEVVLGWVLPTDLRFGCARGLENSPLAILDCYAALGGVF